ncbi:MAG TPA: Hint domain-containing protein [Rhodopila sp.]
MSGTYSYAGAIIQTVTIQTTGTYDITAFGGQGGQGGSGTPGGGGTGGLGAEIGGTFSLTAGEVLQIVVGGYGRGGGNGGGGGGGGSFVIETFNGVSAVDTPLVIAGGGGGGGFNLDSPGFQGGGGQTGGSGQPGYLGGGAGGSNGSGGDNGGSAGGGGGGYSGGIGAAAEAVGTNGNPRGSGYAGGGTQGYGGNGGFGGGGGGAFAGGGGGGGYSGGGGGGYAAFGFYGGGGGGGSLDGGANQVLVASENTGNGSVIITPVCYCLGTHIRTSRGDIAVEQLTAGDRVVTARGGTRPVIWIGHRRIDLTRHVDPVRARPVRIAAGAFPDGTPHRDLLVSPDHAVVFDGVLIPVRLLINGASIAPDMACREVVYFHVELDSHDIIFAEGLQAESYLDTGNRGMFENGSQPMVLHPDFGTGQQARVSLSCLPFADHPDQVQPVWRLLADRAVKLGWVLPKPALTDDPDLHLLAGTRRIDPVAVQGRVYTFVVPPGDAPIRLSSRSACPREARPWIADDRRLGAMVQGLAHRGRDDIRVVALDHPALQQGWWDVEWDDGRFGRWTDGNAELLNLGAGVLEVVLSGTMRYPAERPAFAGERAVDAAAA